MSLLAARDLDVRIADIDVVSGLEFAPGDGECWALLGPNGVGKTTLLKCLAGLHPASGGRVTLAGEPLEQLPRRAIARQLGMLQQHTVYPFDASVLQTVLTGRHPHLKFWAREGAHDHELAEQALRAMDLDGFGGRSVAGLSGGEARRVACAALMVQAPSVLLLDEPTNHLDLRHQLMIMDWLDAALANSERCAVVAMHDVNLAARYASHLLMLFGDGQWCGGATGDMLTAVALERLYGCPVECVETTSGPRFHPAGDVTPRVR